MPLAVRNLTDRDLTVMWDGDEYELPAHEEKVFTLDAIANHFAKYHNRKQYGTPQSEREGKLPTSVKQVEVYEVSAAEYVRKGAAPAKQTFKHDDGSEFDNIPDLLEYTRLKAVEALQKDKSDQQPKQPPQRPDGAQK
jgi:hypothetical protein